MGECIECEDALLVESECLGASRLVRCVLLAAALAALPANSAWADEPSKDRMRVIQSRKFAAAITPVVSALKERLEEAGGKCYITLSFYPPGEGHDTGAGNCNFSLSDKPTTLEKIARGASFIPLVGAALSWTLSSKADADKDKFKDSFVTVIRFEAVGHSNSETVLRTRAFTTRQRMIGDEKYYKELFEKLADAVKVQAEEVSPLDIDP